MTNPSSTGERAVGASARHAEGHRPPRGWTLFSAAGRTQGPPLAGEVLGRRFELVRPIGEGGMSVVYLARDRQLPRPVAVKIFRARDPVAEQRFFDEVELLATLSHPGLVAPLGRGRTAGGQLYMAMELVRGENLRERLDARGPLPWRQAVAIGMQVGEVLAVLHAAGVIHRDVKPGNIMLCSGPEVVIKLLDLGVAKRPPGSPTRFETEMGVAPGTPHYQPPEAGLMPADPRLDVFGLAATIYELCTGERPERGSYRPIHPSAPPELDTVLAEALALDVDARTPTIASLLASLRRVQSGRERLLDGRYELLRPLGVGGRAEVLLAHHRLAGRDVALKRLHAGRQTDEERARLRREARVLAELRHPAFPTLYDVHEHDGQLYLAMEFAQGERAGNFVQRPLCPAHVLAVGIQLAEALVALHSLGVVHRDIHGSNVLIDFAAALSRDRSSGSSTSACASSCRPGSRACTGTARRPSTASPSAPAASSSSPGPRPRPAASACGPRSATSGRPGCSSSNCSPATAPRGLAPTTRPSHRAHGCRAAPSSPTRCSPRSTPTHHTGSTPPACSRA